MKESALATATADVRAEMRQLLERVRERSLLLMSNLSEHDAVAQHDPLMSPVVWDLGHIAAFESLWLDENLRRAVQFGEMPGIYNPFENPRAKRAELPLPSLASALAELSATRDRTWELLEKVNLDADANDALLANGYVYRMVAQHESQHQETILQTLQLKKGAPYAPPARRPVPEAAGKIRSASMVRFPGGEVEIGTGDRSAAYDNERPAHTARLDPFEIDVCAVTNEQFAAFVDEGGYENSDFWADEGRAWLAESGATAPKHWFRDGGEWLTREMDAVHPIGADAPVVHVCFHEAAAYARYASKRLPTEQEWEAAATWSADGKRDYPWGAAAPDTMVANLDHLSFGTAPVGAYPQNVSPIGCYGMIGDVWEWTSSYFGPYPGFETFPYAEYSQVFFGNEYRVLRGGSWATAPHVARATFRNWDYPIRRQIFAGFRCARDA